MHILETIFALLHATLGQAGIESFRVALPDFAGGTGSETGGVGHLIAAAMQTAGVHAQAEILGTFQGFLKQLAALCYLASIVSALVSASMFGNYQRAAYLLIGPPLFFFMVTTTKQVSGAPVINGERIAKGSVQDQMKFLRSYVNNEGKFAQNANVSWFFYGFDNVVSSVVQGIVSVIIDTKNSEDLVVKARERVLSWMLLTTPTDPGFVKLISLGTMGECAEVLRVKWELRSHRVNPKSDSLADGNLDQIGKDMQQRYTEESRRPRFELDHEVIALLNPKPETQEKFRHEKKSCEYIWKETHRIAKSVATNQLDLTKYLAQSNDDGTFPKEQVQKEIKLALAQGADAADVLAAYIVKNAIANTTHASMTASVFDRVPFNAERRSGIFEEVNETHRYGGYLRVQFFAKTIPYIQGIFLYLLACAFPFYAVFLVMPGRANTFLVWMSLWIWVKTWDVGFALVSVARKILWLFVRGGVNRYDAGNVQSNSIANTGVDWSKPESIFSLITANDPLATQNLYYTIIGMLTIAVPFMTAHFCLGASNLWDVFSMNIAQRGDYYFSRRMKQVSRADHASPAEAAQQGLRGEAAIQAGQQAIEAAQGRGSSASGAAAKGGGPGAMSGGGGAGGGAGGGTGGGPKLQRPNSGTTQ